MRPFWTGVAVVAAFAVQSTLVWLTPGYARFLDPFLVVAIYCALTRGEEHGMLAAAVAGFVQDTHFGGRVVGLSGLSKVLVTYVVGVAGARFQLAAALPRALVLVLATFLDAFLLGSLAAVFDVSLNAFPAWGHVLRALANAALGLLAFNILERFGGET